jgi:hypothetical protein
MIVVGKTGWIAGCLAVAIAGLVVAAESRSLLREVKRNTVDSFKWNPLSKGGSYEMVLNVTNIDESALFKVPSANCTADGGESWNFTEGPRNADFTNLIQSAESSEDGKPYKPIFRGAFEGKGGGVKGGQGGGAPAWKLEGEYDVPKVELKAVIFTSDHGVLRDYNSDFNGSGVTVYSPRGWVKGGANNPVSHTRQTNVSVNVVVCAQPAGVNLSLNGTCAIPGLSFPSTAFVSTGSDQSVPVTSSQTLLRMVDIPNTSVSWAVNTQVVRPIQSDHRDLIRSMSPAAILGRGQPRNGSTMFARRRCL